MKIQNPYLENSSTRLDRNFCERLEYAISKALESNSDEATKGLWCDGVLLSELDKSYSQKTINANRQAEMKAYVSKDGQATYQLIVKFGNKALSRYARGLDIISCIPQKNFEDRFSIDTSTKRIEIQLD